jgi:RNA polymerase sigma-70 factor (ECF subfamily)
MPSMAEASGQQQADEALMQRYAAGDVRAFETLYARHELKIWRYLYRSVGNQATADELMQEVWFAVCRSAARYEPGARFTTWLYTLAHHRLIDSHRRARPACSLEAAREDGEPWAEALADPGSPDPARQAEAQQGADALMLAVGRLPPEQRDAFLLQAEGALSVEQIAAASGVSFETAKSRLRYARATLRQALQAHA